MKLLWASRLLAVTASLLACSLQAASINDTSSDAVSSSPTDWSARLSVLNQAAKVALKLKKPLSKTTVAKLLTAESPIVSSYQSVKHNPAKATIEGFSKQHPIPKPHVHDENCEHKEGKEGLKLYQSESGRASVKVTRKPNEILKQKAYAEIHGNYREPSDMSYHPAEPNYDKVSEAPFRTAIEPYMLNKETFDTIHVSTSPSPLYPQADNSQYKPNVRRVVVIRKPASKEDIPVIPQSSYYGFHEPSSVGADSKPDRKDTLPAHPYPKKARSNFNIPSYDRSDENRFEDIKDEISDSSERISLPTGSSEEYYQAPKFDLMKSGSMNEKGCKMVIKEIKQVPSEHARASDLRSLFRAKRSPPEGKRLSSIVMMKECYFPDAPAAGSSDFPRFQPGEMFGEKKEASRRSQHHSPERSGYDGGYESDFPDSFWKDYSRESSEIGPQKQVEPPRRASERTYYRPRELEKPRQMYYSSSTNNHGSEPRYNKRPNNVPYQESTVHQASSNRGQNRRPDEHRHVSRSYQGDYEPYDRYYGSSPSSYQESSPRGYGGGQGRRHGGHGDNHDGKPKAYRRSFEYYKRDDDKKKKDPNNYAEEYASGSYGSYSSNYDSERDGPRRKQ